MRVLTQKFDGIDGADLGIHGEWQFAWVGTTPFRFGHDTHIYRRRASEAGTYGGWRWECYVEHALNNPTIYPGLAEAINTLYHER
jgi:hypothetical protein